MQVRPLASVFHAWPRTTGWSAAARSPRTWVATMTVVGVIGGGLAISHATETDWLTHMSLSGLGMDSGASGILNTTLVALGLILVALAVSLEGTFAGLSSAARLSPRAHRLLSVGFMAAGAAVAVGGLFRNDGQALDL